MVPEIFRYTPFSCLISVIGWYIRSYCIRWRIRTYLSVLVRHIMTISWRIGSELEFHLIMTLCNKHRYLSVSTSIIMITTRYDHSAHSDHLLRPWWSDYIRSVYSSLDLSSSWGSFWEESMLSVSCDIQDSMNLVWSDDWYTNRSIGYIRSTWSSDE